MAATLKTDVQVLFNKLVDDIKTDSLSNDLVTTMTTTIVRGDVKILSAAAETSYLPTGVTTINFLLIMSVDAPILYRTVAAGTQYKIPAGGFALFQAANTGLSDIRLAGGGAGDSQVIFIVGM